MYYENKKEKLRNQFITFVLLVVIILLLCVLILKIDKTDSTQVVKTNYETEKLLTESKENVEKGTSKTIENVTKCVVGISKLEQNGKTIFVENAEKILGLGSGIILSDNGYILTNEHVSGSKYSNCFVTLENGKVYSGTVLWSDSNLDLSIIKISANGLNYINLGDSDNISLADEVYAIGNPIGIEFQRTITKGIISGINRTIKIEETEDSGTYMEDLIQTDATINEGNSGGPLVNLNGELIGVNTVKISDAEGIGFAVPINIVKPILEKLIQNGKFEEAYLGIFGYDKEVIPYLSNTSNSNLSIESGIYVASIQIDGPLFNAELNEGDIICSIDGVKINKMNDLRKYIYTKNPGDNVTLLIERNNIKKEIEVTLGGK